MSQSVNNIASFKCSGAAILPNRIVFLGGSGTAITAFATSNSIGVSTEVGGDANLTMDVTIGGIAYLQVGAIINPGTLLGSDADGKGAAAVVGNRVIGVLLEPATAVDQICKILIAPSVL